MSQPELRIQASALQGIERLLSQHGQNPEHWLLKYGLTPEQLHTPDQSVDLKVFITLLQDCAQSFHCADFGMQLGAQQDFRILGPLGLLLQNCETPREALSSARGYMWFHNQGEYWDYSQQGDLAYLERIDLFHELYDTRQYKELSLSTCLQLCRLLIGPRFQPERIEFKHAPQLPIAHYEKRLKTRVLFNCEHDQLVVSAHYLDETISEARLALKQLATRYLASWDSQQPSLALRVSNLIQQNLPNQQPTIDHIASLMGLSRRTLQRRLEAENLVFKQLLLDIRMKTACWYLASSSIDVTLLSQVLGYQDVSAFSRAFRHYHQCSPMQWRKQQNAQP